MRSVIVVRYFSPLFQPVPVQLVIQSLPGDTQLFGCIRRVPGGSQGLEDGAGIFRQVPGPGLQHVLADDFLGIVVDYLDVRMNESPEYIASRCDAMMCLHIHTTLQNIDLIKKGQF